MNILICAYACNPEKFSEHHVGWSVVANLSRLAPEYQIYVVTRLKNRQAIEGYRALENVHFIYFDLPTFFQNVKSKSGFVRLYYYFWSVLGGIFVHRYLAKLKIKIDLVHHVTFVCDWLPSIGWLIARRSKFLFGPVGTNDYQSTRSRSALSVLVETLKVAMRRFDPFVRATISQSNLVLVNNQKSRDFFSSLGYSCEIYSAIGTSPVLEIEEKEPNKDDALTICFVGRLIEIKRLHLFLNVFEALCHETSDILAVIVGDGPNRSKLQEHAGLKKFSARLSWKPSLSHRDCLELIRSSDVLIFTSYEAAGLPLIEAAAHGVCTISSEKGLMSSMLKPNDFALFKELGDKSIISQICGKILLLNEDRKYLKELGDRNQLLAKDFEWDRKIHYYLDCYRMIIDSKLP